MKALAAMATTMTKGLILTNKKGKLKPTFYHSSCGGQLFTPHEVWQNKVNGYQRKRCPYCHGNIKRINGTMKFLRQVF